MCTTTMLVYLYAQRLYYRHLVLSLPNVRQKEHSHLLTLYIVQKLLKEKKIKITN